MKKNGFAFIAMLFLAGCAMSFDTFDQALPVLKGKNIAVAINHLGIPDQKYPVDDHEVYVWSTTENHASLHPVTTTVTGLGSTPFNAVGTSYVSETSQLSCEIKIMTKKKVIQRIEYEGSNGTCMTYAERLKPLVTAR